MAWQKRRKTAVRYDTSVRSIQRWEADAENTGFPPSRLIGRCRYDCVELLDAWDAACATRGRAKLTSPAVAARATARSTAVDA
jgi:hypothetical protein